MMEREFSSMAALAVHLAGAAVALDAAAHHGLEKCAELIEKTAKDEIGTYQPEVGPFPAWAPLADATVADRVANGYSPDEPLLRTGDLRDSIKHEVQGLEAVVGSQSDIAAYQEFGTRTIPPRPFIGPAAFRNGESIKRIVGAVALHALEYGPAGALASLAIDTEVEHV